MWPSFKNVWTSVGGVVVLAGYIVGVVVNPIIGEALKAGGTLLIGLAAKDNEQATQVTRSFMSTGKE